MSEESKDQRCRFLGMAAMTIAAAQLGRLGCAQSRKAEPTDATTIKPGDRNTSFGSRKQIDAGVLNGADAPRRHIQAYERHSS